MRLIAVALLITALFSAGCTGSSDKPNALESAVDVFKGPSDAELRATPGSIEGLVLTPSVSPIGGARVTLLRENVSVVTDAGGFFRFAGLRNGAYLVSAEAEGYQVRTVQATAVNGTVYEINLTLTPAPSNTPFVETRELKGLLACGLVAEAPTGRVDPPCSAADANHRDAFEVDLVPDGKTLVVEITWDTEQNPGASTLRLIVETVGYGALDEEFGNVTGSGYARIEVTQPLMEKYYPEGGRFRLRVLLEPGATPAGAALQTPFTAYTSVGYHAALPADFTVIS